MKSVRAVAPFLAAGVAAGVLDPRAFLSIGPDGSQCPAPRVDTLIVQPAYYSEFFPYTAVIDPFRNQMPFTVSNAPTTVILSTELPVTVIYGGSVTVPVNPGSTTATTTTTTSPIAGGSGSASVSATGTTSSASSTITAGPALAIGAGLPQGAFTDAADFIVLAYGNAVNQPAKRQVKRQAVVAGANPVVVVDLATNDGPNAYGTDAANCDSGTPLLLSGGMLINGARAIAKPNLASEAVVGFLVDPMSTPVNATIIVTNGLLSWQAADGVGSADWYSCPDGLWAAFPTLDPGRMARCTRVQVGAIAGDACSSLVLQSRPVNLGFTRPQNLVRGDSTTTTTSVSTTSNSAATVTTATGTVTFSTVTSAVNTSSTSDMSQPSNVVPSGSQSSVSASSDSGSSVTLPSVTVSLSSVSLPSVTISLSSVTDSLSSVTLPSVTVSLSSVSQSSMSSMSPSSESSSSVPDSSVSITSASEASSSSDMSSDSSSITRASEASSSSDSSSITSASEASSSSDMSSESSSSSSTA